MNRFLRATSLLLIAILSHAQGPPATGEDIVEQLMPSGSPVVLHLPTPADASATIAKLKAEQADPNVKRPHQVAFLLAILGADYEANRQYLIHALQGCGGQENQGCKEETLEYLIYLYERGDERALLPLMRAGPKSDGAPAELLSVFYRGLLVAETTKFLRLIEQFSIKDQRQLCESAAYYSSSSLLRQLLRKHSSPTAVRCLKVAQQMQRAEMAGEIGENDGGCSTARGLLPAGGTIATDEGVAGSPLTGWVGYFKDGVPTPLEGMVVECFRQGWKGRVASANTDAKGHFSLPEVRQGVCYLKGTAPHVETIWSVVRISNKTYGKVCLITAAVAPHE